MPSDADESITTEEDDTIERQLDDEEESRAIWVGLELFAVAVTEEKGGDSTEPQKKSNHAALEDLIESSHIFVINNLLFKNYL